MNVFHDFTERIRTAVRAVVASDFGGREVDLTRVVVEPPRDASYGDLATNAAMVLAKPLEAVPRELAEHIADRLAGDLDVDAASVAGPGFINLTLRERYWQAFLGRLLEVGERYGRSDIGAGEPINVEYVSANPTGPMHVGHCRGAVFGDALSNLLAFAGYKVTREYYINDAGAQVDALARSAFLRYREALGQDVGEIPAGLYPGEYLKPVGEKLAREHGVALLELEESDWLPLVRTIAVDAMMTMIREDLAALNVRHDVFFSERSLLGETNRVEEAIEVLRARGLIYTGVLPPPKGQLPDDWEDREQTLFRSTEFGDDIDRPLMKSDGTYTYFASDIAYHYDKYRRGFRKMIDVLGADHGGYVRRIQAAVKAVSGGEATVDARICQLVRLFRAGEPVKMSKRAGEFVTLRDVVDEVGVDPVRFMMVFRKNDAPLDFDFEKVTEQSKDNPVFYVQYAHARAESVFRQARAELPELSTGRIALLSAPFDRLADKGEMTLIRRIAAYPRVVEAAAETHEPHRVAFYLYELAADFHAQWNRGKESPHLRFINRDDTDSTLARLALVHAVKLVLASGLAILGVGAPGEMR
jgi:arginyl-tRNA synthetase